MGFGEMVMIGIVLLLVVGPRELPRLLRAVGQGVRKLRTLSTDLRSQSGIDEIIRDEGLREDLDAIRSLSRGRVVDSLVRDAMRPARRPTLPRQPQVVPTDELTIPEGTAPTTEDERPAIGPDAYGALADDAKIPPKPALPPAEAIPPLGTAQDEVAVPAGSAPAAEEPG
jgi:sec-independent protein translocase protein TatB